MRERAGYGEGRGRVPGRGAGAGARFEGVGGASERVKSAREFPHSLQRLTPMGE